MLPLLSSHEFHLKDEVARHGRSGVVVDALVLYVLIRWEDGAEEEVEQFDPTVTVQSRVAGENSSLMNDELIEFASW